MADNEKYRNYITGSRKFFRMGSPKQLLLYQGKTFLERITDTALEVFDPNQIVLVLGARHHEISSVIKNKNIHIVINETGNQEWLPPYNQE